MEDGEAVIRGLNYKIVNTVPFLEVYYDQTYQTVNNSFTASSNIYQNSYASFHLESREEKTMWHRTAFHLWGDKVSAGLPSLSLATRRGPGMRFHYTGLMLPLRFFLLSKGQGCSIRFAMIF